MMPVYETSTSQLGALLRDMFKAADADGNGVLDKVEFIRLVKSTQLGLSRRQQMVVIDAADFDLNGYVDYLDFIPLMIEIIEEQQISAEDPQLQEAEELAARSAATEFMTRDMPQAQFSAYCGTVFKKADTDEDGVLSEEEFEKSVQKMDLGLTFKEIKFMMVEFASAENKLVYQDFAASFFEVAVDLVAGKLLEGAGTFSELQEHFMRLFAEADKDGGGMLSCTQLAEAMLLAKLTPVQIETILMEATQDSRKLVRYSRFARICTYLALDFWEGTPPYEAPIPMPRLEDLSLDELVFFLRKRFLEVDKDRNGVLSQREFSDLLRDSGLGLSKRTFRRVMEAVDMRDDGFIEYSVFVPVVIDIIQASRVLEKNREDRLEEEMEARTTAAAYMMDGIPRDQLEANLDQMFRDADVNASGTLSQREFSDCLRNCDLGLTKKEIQSLMVDVNTSKSGLVLYEEFTPLAYEVLVELMKEKLLEDGGRLRELQAHFYDEFARRDVENIGKISLNACRQVVNNNRMTAIQVETILSEAVTDERNMVQYRKFSRVVAPMAFEFWGGRLPDSPCRTNAMGSPRNAQSMLTLRSPIARDLADFRAVVAAKVDPLGALWQASQTGDMLAIAEALADGGDPNAVNDSGWSALHWAAHNGHEGAAGCLLDNDACLELHDNDGWSPLHHAASQGHDAVATLLLNCGADIDEKASGTFARAPLHLAAWNGHASTILSLINNGAGINTEDEPSGMTALHYASRFNRPEALATLLEAGADVEAITRDGKAAIHFAAREGHERCVALLVEAGAQLGRTTTDVYQRTALHWASYNGHLNVVQYLVSAGAPMKCIDTDGQTPMDLAGVNEDLHAAIAAGQAERMEPQRMIGQ